MADNSKDISVKLLAGQQKIEKDVAVLKTDVAVLKTDVAVLKTDVAELKIDVTGLKTDVAELKTDVADLKEGQNRVENFLINLENIIMPKINAIYENSISNKQQTKKLEEAESKNAQKLDNHELRITRLEQSG